ncbi:MAG: hypothetical protein ABIS47_09195 [Acidimicrobiales bacterium]
MLKRRLAHLVLVALVTAGAGLGAAACGGATAGSGRTSPPSSTGK